MFVGRPIKIRPAQFPLLAVPVRGNGRFRQTVELVNRRGQGRPQIVLQVRGQGFTLGNNMPETRCPRRSSLLEPGEEVPEYRGNKADDSDPLALDHVDQVVDILIAARPRQHGRCAFHQPRAKFSRKKPNPTEVVTRVRSRWSSLTAFK